MTGFCNTIIFFFLLMISQISKGNVIWRTTSGVGFSQSFMQTQIVNQLNNSSTYPGTSPIDIDIDQNGTIDFRFNYKILDRGVSSTPLTCTEGNISFALKNGNWDLMPGSGNISNFYVDSRTDAIIDPLSAAWNPFSSSWGLIELDMRLFTPYPSAKCYGNSYSQPGFKTPVSGSGYTDAASAKFDSGFFIGLKFIRNGNIHMCWMKFQSGFFTEMAWEDVPLMPIKIGSKNSVLNQIDNQFVFISGQVYVDANGNCIKESTESTLAGAEVQIKNTSYNAITTASGYYGLYVPYQNGNTYELDVQVKNTYGTVATCNQLTLSAITAPGESIFKSIAVTPNTCANVEVKIETKPLRRCSKSSFTVNYQNTGTLAATGRQMKIALPQWVKAISSVPAWTSKVNDTLTYNLASLAGLGKGVITVIDSVVCGEELIRGMDQCIKAYVIPSATCAAGVIYAGPEVNVKGICQDGILNLTISNDGGSMIDSLNYRISLDKTLVKDKKYKLASGENFILQVPAHGKSVYAEVDQSALHPVLASRTFAMEGCGDFQTDVISKGIIHTLPYIKEGNTESTVCATIVDSYDPNDKTAMPGEGLIKANQDIYYTIRFQNSGTATAYHVVVDDTLSAHLDVSSLEIVSSSHPQIMSNYLFQLGGKQLLKFTFYNINLVTKTSSEALSQGYVTFKISQKENLPVGTQIKNKSFIYFDFNSAIITNETMHTVGEPLADGVLKVTQTLSDQSTCEGQAVNLSLMSQHEEKYMWYKDDVLLAGEEQNELFISSLDNNTIGTYSCKVIGVLDTITTVSEVALKSVAECLSTGNTESQNDAAVVLYPNPAKSDFYIRTIEEGVYSIRDTYGFLIEKGTLLNGVNLIHTTQPLKQGRYIVSVETNKDTQVRSLILQ